MTTRIIISNTGPSNVLVRSHGPLEAAVYAESMVKPGTFSEWFYVHSGQHITVIEEAHD